MNAACLRCNLKALNRYEYLMKGKYARQFDLQENPQNKQFVNNPYVPGKCDTTQLVCFDLVKGAKKCSTDKTLMLGFDAQGNLVTTKNIRHY